MKPNANIAVLILVACIGFSQLFSQFAAAAPPVAEGGIAGGGGHALVCSDGRYYSFDYKVTEGQEALNPDLQRICDENAAAIFRMSSPELAMDSRRKAATDILANIAHNLKSRSPLMGANLEEFIESIRSDIFQPGGGSRYWSRGRVPLSGRPSSRLRIPRDCLALGQMRVAQAVIRFNAEDGVVRYTTDENVLDSLSNNSPMQLSFLYMHEFLRDYTEDYDALANGARLLHGSSWLNSNRAGLQTAFRRIGLDTSRF